jgi:murein DD-endopeptidase MepM/ murein hydrolase activator NlpD
VNHQETRADKPRRALPAQSHRVSGEVLKSLLRRGAAVAVVSGIGLAGLATFTASASSAASPAYAIQTPLGLSSIGTDFGSDKTPSAADLAEQRNQALTAEVSAIGSASADTATTQRFQAMGQNATALDAENTRLKTLAKFIWPTNGSVGSVFGMRMHPILHYMRMHDGDDIGGNCNQPIWAAQSGIVVKAEMGYNGGSGNNVWIDNGDISDVNVQSGYLHMAKYLVSVGEKVNKGDVIGYVGSTGLSTACHLHFSIKKDGVESDPMEYIGWNPEAKGAPTHN